MTPRDRLQNAKSEDKGWSRREFLICAAAGAAAVMAASWLSRAAGETKAALGETKALADLSALSLSTAKLLDSSPHNRVPGTDVRVYGAPIFAASSAQDPLYRKLKDVLGHDHFMPGDLLSGARTVICWFLPYSEAVSKSNYGKDDAPDLWVRAHHQGARAAELVRRHVQQELAQTDARVFVPFHDKRYRNGRIVSNWSERHVAFVSGLGTFGLHKNLITAKGASGRLDSAIVDREFAPTSRASDELYGNCINCHACVRRCPVGAITETGKNIGVCARRVLAGKRDPEQAVCGKCLTDVPCENCIPRRA